MSAYYLSSTGAGRGAADRAEIAAVKRRDGQVFEVPWKAEHRPRFRWSAFRQPGEGLVARGGVEPPTFRFSGGRSYQLSYLAVLRLMVPGPGSGQSIHVPDKPDAAREPHGVQTLRS
jgi:hypothetical protein